MDVKRESSRRDDNQVATITCDVRLRSIEARKRICCGFICRRFVTPSFS